MPVWSYETHPIKYGPGLESTQGVGARPMTYVMISNGGKEESGWTTVHRGRKSKKRT
jgi:hypothetical protein